MKGQSCDLDFRPAVEDRIHYPFHPRCGETVLIIGRFAYRGTELVVIPQPDNSIACIPAWMTQQSAAQYRLCAEPQFSLEVLRSLRADINALLGFLQPDSKMEEDRAAGSFCVLGRDWHTLIEFCGLVGTILIDEDGG